MLRGSIELTIALLLLDLLSRPYDAIFVLGRMLTRRALSLGRSASHEEGVADPDSD